jgi:hypothetical protein
VAEEQASSAGQSTSAFAPEAATESTARWLRSRT